MDETITGGCQCGAVRYVLHGRRPPVIVCHCRECQKQSASAFGMSLPARAADLVVEGRLESWERDTDLGTGTRCYFCPSCGSRIYHQSAASSNRVTVKGGSLDETGWLRPAAHIWVSRKQPWVTIDPTLPSHPTQPEDFAAWRSALVEESE